MAAGLTMSRGLRIGIVIVVAMAGGWALFTRLPPLGDQSLARVMDAGVIRIGYAVEAPYAFLDPWGRVTGESAEVARAVIARMGNLRTEWKHAKFDDLIPALEAGEIDVAAAGMYITPVRTQRVAFSDPTLHVQQGLLVQAGNPRHLHSYEEARGTPECRFATISSSVEEQLLRRLGLSEAQILLVPDALTGRVAVESGVACGLALSIPSIQWMAARTQLGRTEAAAPFTQPEGVDGLHNGYVAFAFRRQDHQLADAWNAAQRAFIGTPAHLQLLGTFGLTSDDVPAGTTALDVLTP